MWGLARCSSAPLSARAFRLSRLWVAGVSDDTCAAPQCSPAPRFLSPFLGPELIYTREAPGWKWPRCRGSSGWGSCFCSLKSMVSCATPKRDRAGFRPALRASPSSTLSQEVGAVLLRTPWSLLPTRGWHFLPRGRAFSCFLSPPSAPGPEGMGSKEATLRGDFEGWAFGGPRGWLPAQPAAGGLSLMLSTAAPPPAPPGPQGRGGWVAGG